MLKKIAKRINKELEQAEDYCTQAMLIHDDYTTVAELFADLSAEEIDHAKRLLKEGEKLITAKRGMSYSRTERTAVPQDTEKETEKCKAIWEWEHRIAMERISEIEYKLSKMRSM